MGPAAVGRLPPVIHRTDRITRRFTRGAVGALAFGVVYTIAATVYSLAQGNTEFVFYVVVMAVLMVVVGAVHLRVGLTMLALWMLAAWGLLHMAGGLLKLPEPTGVLYNWWIVGSRNGQGLKFDQFVHAYGFGTATWVCWQCLRGSLADPRPRLGPLMLCALGAAGLGAFNEIIEFTATQIMEKTNVGGYENNSWDLVFNMLGACAAAVAIRAAAGNDGRDDGGKAERKRMRRG